MTLPLEISKQINRTCLYSGCTEPALEDSDFCGPHEAHERGRAANRQRRHRQKLAAAGLCRSGCGRKVPRRRGPDGKVVPRRCTKCRKEHAERMREIREKRGSPAIDRGVTGDSPEADRITVEREGDGYARSRYHGQARRGQQKRHQLDLQDLDDAIDRLQRAKRGVLLAVDAEAAQMPRVQRDEIRMEAMSHADLAGRFVESVLERNHYDRGEMIDSAAKTGR